jgi:hypothetical protein
MDELNSRGESLAESFFAKRDKELLQKLKEELSNSDDRTALKAASGIEDDAVLQGLVDQVITPESLTAVSLIPLVTVAWADREMSAAEKSAILKAAADAGVTADSAAYSVVEGWLQTRPELELLEAWKNYVDSIKSKLDPAATGQLKHSVMTRSKEVAKASGGYLGLSKVSSAEQAAIDDLEAAFG